MLWRVHRRTVNPSPLGKHCWFESNLIHHIKTLCVKVFLYGYTRGWWNGIHRRLKISRRKAYGFESRLSYQFGSKVFMDAHGTVTAEEWGSLPPRPANVWKAMRKYSILVLIQILILLFSVITNIFIVAGVIRHW